MQYIWTPRDANGEFLDGGKHYALHLPPDQPVKVFWSVIVYDSASRSALHDGTCGPGLSAYNSKPNADGSVDLYFGPTAPADGRRNWIRTVQGRRWFPCLRFYSPLEPLFDHPWTPGEIVEIRAEVSAAAGRGHAPAVESSRLHDAHESLAAMQGRVDR